MSKKKLFEDCEPKWIETLKNDPDCENRAGEALSLGEWGSESAVQPLCDAAQGDKCGIVRFRAVEAIGKAKIKHALITAKLKPNPTEIRKHAEKVFKEIKNKFPNDLM